MITMDDEAMIITPTTKTYDADGFEQSAEEFTLEVFCAMSSVKRSEAYEALRSGIKAVYICTVNSLDYDYCIQKVSGKKYRPKYVEYDDERLQIIRTYQKEDDLIELTLAEME